MLQDLTEVLQVYSQPILYNNNNNNNNKSKEGKEERKIRRKERENKQKFKGCERANFGWERRYIIF